MDLDTILADFDALEPGEERTRYLIDLGRRLAPYPDDARDDAHKVSGCLSQVWIRASLRDGVLHLQGDSDAIVVRGLVSLLLTIYAGRTPAEAAALDPRPIFEGIGLEGHLSVTRRNGLWSMVTRIRAHAAALT